MIVEVHIRDEHTLAPLLCRLHAPIDRLRSHQRRCELFDLRAFTQGNVQSLALGEPVQVDIAADSGFDALPKICEQVF